MRRLSLWGMLAFTLLAAGCVRSTMVRVPITFAAKVPVRVFPSVWVATGHFDEDERIGDVLSAHLAEDRQIEVRRVDIGELEPARTAGKIPATTAVVLIDLELREGDYQYWDNSPYQSCGYYGCSTQYRSFVSTAPQISAQATLTVYEGPTARVLQRERVGRSLIGNDPQSVRLDVIELLASDVSQLVDSLRVTERVVLEHVDMPEVDAAIEQIEAGRWGEGRELLERAKQNLGGLKRKTQARVWYDLGTARRFAPGPQGLDQAAYESAKRALTWALRLNPTDAYQRALVKLEKHYRSLIDLAEQERARKYNLTLPREAEAKKPPAEPAAAPASEPPPAPPVPPASEPVAPAQPTPTP